MGAGVAGLLAGSSALFSRPAASNLAALDPVTVPLKVRPALVCELSSRREATSWRP